MKKIQTDAGGRFPVDSQTIDSANAQPELAVRAHKRCNWVRYGDYHLILGWFGTIVIGSFEWCRVLDIPFDILHSAKAIC